MVERRSAWKHLEDDRLDCRFIYTAKNIDVKDKNILDFNCGFGRFAYFVDGYRSYLGNDIEPDFIDRCPHERGTFIVMEDAKLQQILGEVDVALYFGVTVGGENESPNASELFIDIVREKQPDTVVVEGCLEYFDEYKQEELFDSSFKNYTKKHIAKFEVGDKAHLKRKVIIYVYDNAK